MNFTRRILLLLFALVTLTLAAGCTPALEYKWVAGDLTYDKLRQGGVAVMPPVSATPQVPPSETQRAHPLMLNTLSRTRPEFPFATLDVVTRAQDGSPEAQQATTRYATAGTVDAAVLQSLGKWTGAKYIVFTKVDSFLTTTSSSSETVDERDSKGRLIRQATYDIFTTSAQLHGAMKVFEAATGKTVWEGTHAVGGSSSNRVQRPAATNAVVVVNVNTGPSAPAYPPPPPPGDLLQSLFWQFVANLPDKD
jgi:hypothetical protein